MRKVILILSVLAVIALAVLNMPRQKGPEPVVVYPIANHNIWN